jgi:DNA-binding IclR family transcriptional regulator
MGALQTVQKIGPVLDLFTVEEPEWGVSEVAATIKVPRSSAHALLASLVDIGLLRCRARGRYRLGWRVVEMGETLRGTLDLCDFAAPTLERLVEQYGETVHLAVLDRWKVLCIDRVLGTHDITMQGARVGSRHDAHATALGKMLLAQLTPTELQRYFARRTLRRLTPATITDKDILVESLVSIRAAGFAVSVGETVTDVHCLAAPIRDDLGAVVAAVSFSVPATRFAQRRPQLHRAIVRAAQDISLSVTVSQERYPSPVRETGQVTALPVANTRAS